MTDQNFDNSRVRNMKAGLKNVLLTACPPDLIDGSVSIPRLSDHIDVTAQGIYRWLRNGKRVNGYPQGQIPVDQARRIASLSDGRVTFEDFLDYL